MKKRVVVIAPGRGTYTKDTLGYLNKYRPHINSFVAQLDENKKKLGEPTVSELDNAEKFSNQVHTKGENASVLIYACSFADFQSLDRNEYDIVAITGNSMGWYTALALGGCLNEERAFEVINTMGSMMKGGVVGGQIIYPIAGPDWRITPEHQQVVQQAIESVNASSDDKVYPSIYLGGYIVIGGSQQKLSELMKKLPVVEHFPFQLINHAAFHTPLLQQVSQKAFRIFSSDTFDAPKIPLIDGRGHIWQPYSSDPSEIYQYTLGHQVVETYDFTSSIRVALKEFAPDQLILLGPGNTLGGAVGQILINEHWNNWQTKKDFQDSQRKEIFLYSMGM